MLAPSPIVKKIAKDALKKDLLKSMAVGSVFAFVVFIAILISSLVAIFANAIGSAISMAVLTTFAVCPLALGVFNYFRRLTYEQNDSVLVIFKYFSSVAMYKRAMQFVLLMAIRLLIAAAILYLPSMVILALSNEDFYSLIGVSLPLWSSNLWALNSFLTFIATLTLIFVMLKYYLAPFIFISNDTVDPAEAVNMSTIISKRTGADFFGLALSFAGWILLSFFVAPIIFTIPYFITSYVVHSEFAITAYNYDVDRFNENAAPRFSTDEL